MMMSARGLMLAAGIMVCCACGGQGAETSPEELATAAPPTSRVGEGEPLGFTAAISLGVVEGVTEFLPVSSTGHLILTNRFLDLDREAQARDREGQLLWEEAPAESADGSVDGVAYTVKAAADDYAVIIQFGAILAVAVIYWRQLLAILAGLLGRDPAGLRLLRNLVVAFLPAAVIGLLAHDWIDAHLFSVQTVAAALVVGSIIMLVVSRWQRQRARAAGGESLPDPSPADLSVGQALTIGFLQCIAMWPGMSRSMITLVGGYLVGLRPVRAAEFSFLLGLVTLSAAGVYKGYDSGLLMIKAFGIVPIVVGCAVAAISAAIAVRWMVAYLNKHGLAVFAWYRLILAAIVVWVWF